MLFDFPQIISCYQYFPERSLSVVIYFGVLVSTVYVLLLFKKVFTSQWHTLLDSLFGQNPPFMMLLWSVLLCVWVRVHSGDRTLVLSFQFCFPHMSSHVIKCQLTCQSHIHFVPALMTHTWKLSHSSLAVSLNVCPLLRPWASVEWRPLSICSVASESLWPHGLQHTRLPCPSLCPRVCSNPCPLSQWCCPIILSPYTLLCFCLNITIVILVGTQQQKLVWSN